MDRWIRGGGGASGIGSKDVSSRGVIARKCIGGDECFVLICKSIFILLCFFLNYFQDIRVIVFDLLFSLEILRFFQVEFFIFRFKKENIRFYILFWKDEPCGFSNILMLMSCRFQMFNNFLILFNEIYLYQRNILDQ